ncbi:dihydroorotase [Xylanibacter ruminicola]|uniref:Dihydroorotase n=1 Tax=Xylanibacter ruminicola TaxID=839 RepID=A0A1H5S5Y6_XYLRU|nr:dihydroorotase [Xylanibacter ruminicola]SEF46036.1 dihydroorotase [Xylanibacter ruminicola]
MRTLIQSGTLVNEGCTFDGSIVIENGKISKVIQGYNTPEASYDEVIDASGCFILPGVIDDHVHFREPGLTEKADIEIESRAAAAGGVTTYFDMPNTVPQTTTLEALKDKFALAAGKSHVNYSFFFGATNDNADLFSQLDVHQIPGIKLFMGSSTGNMLVDRREALEKIFELTPLPLMAHCEDTDIINRNMAEAKQKYGDDPRVQHHPEIRSEEACYESTRLAVELAKKHMARLHVAHLTTARELDLFEPSFHTQMITAEATVSHLYFCDRDYFQLGTRIKCNPAIKTQRDRDALRDALNDGRITVIGTDHAPHLLAQKEGGCACAASGMPMIQFSLVTMLELVDQGVLSIERLVELMCHNPAKLFEVRNRGFLREGYQADIVLVRPNTAWIASKENILSRCGWSPMEGHMYLWRVERTLCNGHTVFLQGKVDTSYIGQPVAFR